MPSNKGLRQGCVIEVPLFSIFFTAVLHAALNKLNSDGDILRDIVRVPKRAEGLAVKECNVAWQKEENFRNLWKMLYANYAGRISRTALSLENIVAIIVNVCRYFGFTASKSKAEIMRIRPEEYGEVMFDFKVDSKKYKQTNKYVPGTP